MLLFLSGSDYLGLKSLRRLGSREAKRLVQTDGLETRFLVYHRAHFRFLLLSRNFVRGLASVRISGKLCGKFICPNRRKNAKLMVEETWPVCGLSRSLACGTGCGLPAACSLVRPSTGRVLGFRRRLVEDAKAGLCMMLWSHFFVVRIRGNFLCRLIFPKLLICASPMMLFSFFRGLACHKVLLAYCCLPGLNSAGILSIKIAF